MIRADHGLPTVSIIVATYNRSELAARTVRSALDQSLESLEVVVSDDASPDRTVERLREIRDPRLRLHVQPQNTGVWKNWSTALGMARGKYVVFLGDDDQLSRGFAANLATLLDQLPSVGAVFSVLDFVEQSGTLIERLPAPFLEGEERPGRDVASALLAGRLYFGSAMFRRMDAVAAWERSADNGLVADWGLLLRLALQPGFRAAASPAATYFKTSHGGQLGAIRGGEVLRSLADLCNRLAGEVSDPAFRRELRRRSAFERIGYARNQAGLGDLSGCRKSFTTAVVTAPTLPVAWSRLLQAYLWSGRSTRTVRPQ